MSKTTTTKKTTKKEPAEKIDAKEYDFCSKGTEFTNDYIKDLVKKTERICFLDGIDGKQGDYAVDILKTKDDEIYEIIIKRGQPISVYMFGRTKVRDHSVDAIDMFLSAFGGYHHE